MGGWIDGRDRGGSSSCYLFAHAGEFGVVYRGHLTQWKGRTKAELVAVKTLKSKVNYRYYIEMARYVAA